MHWDSLFSKLSHRSAAVGVMAVGALAGALDGWRLLWKSDPVVGALAVRLELGSKLWLVSVSVSVSTPSQSVDAMEVQSMDAMEV